MGTPRARIERALHGTVARPRPFASNAIMCFRRVSTTQPMATMFILAMVSRMTAKASCPTLPPGAR